MGMGGCGDGEINYCMWHPGTERIIVPVTLVRGGLCVKFGTGKIVLCGSP